MWIRTCFGLKSAPLVRSRFAAALGRLLRSLLPEGAGSLQIYLGDPLWILRGPADERCQHLALALLTLRSLGVRVSWPKGHRGSSIEWIGVTLTIRDDHAVLCCISKRLADELMEEANYLRNNTYVSWRRLRRFVGRLNWATCVQPRLRWTTRILYAAVLAAEREDVALGSRKSQSSEAGALRAARRRLGLVATKRRSLALQWAAALWQKGSLGRARVFYCTRPAPKFCICLLYNSPRPRDRTRSRMPYSD